MVDTLADPTRRVVLLGASNLTRAMATVFNTTRAIWNEPLDVLAALGHGRSYGMRSNVLGRSLSGIVQSGLWESLERRSSLPTTALVTDIGNDVLYHVPVEQIVDWVERCLDRLARVQARVVMTELPAGNVASLSRARFLFFRTLFMPFCRLSLEETTARVYDLNDRLQRIATERGVTFVHSPQQWYGLDPIHIRMAHWPSAWREILSPWADPGAAIELARRTPALALKLWLLSPDERAFFGFTRRCEQPCVLFRDGTRISIY